MPGVRGVTDLMVMPGLINLDFADIRTVMSEMGKAMMGTGEAEGERRAIDAAEAAINNPLLEDVSMKGARGVLINITGGTDMTLFEVDEAANRIREEVDPDANIIFGSTFDEKLAGRMRISVVATGIEAEAATQEQARPALGRAPPRRRRRAARHGHRLYAAGADAERGEPPASRGEPGAEPAGAEKRAEAPPSRSCPRPRRPKARRCAAARLLRRVRSIRARPGRRRSRHRPCRRRRRRAGAAPRPKGRVPSLIERVTGIGRARPPAPPRRRAPRRRPAQPAAPPRPAKQRLAPLEEPRADGQARARKTICSTSRPSCAARRTENAEAAVRPAIRCPVAGGTGPASQCDTAAAACSSTSAPVVKRSSANGAASGCGSSRAIVWAKTQPAPGVALNPPVPQPPFR